MNMTNASTFNADESNFMDDADDDFETMSDHHRAAAHHFTQAARHHLAAALASDDGAEELADRHTFLAYRHRLTGTQFAEIVVMESESSDEDLLANDA